MARLGYSVQVVKYDFMVKKLSKLRDFDDSSWSIEIQQVIVNMGEVCMRLSVVSDQKQ